MAITTMKTENNYNEEISELEKQPEGHFVGGDPNFPMNYRENALEFYRNEQSRLARDSSKIISEYLDYIVEKYNLKTGEFLGKNYSLMGYSVGNPMGEHVFVTVAYQLRHNGKNGKKMSVSMFEEWAKKNRRN